MDKQSKEQHSRASIARFARSCCVSAGAGAGKTASMVRAYLTLLQEGLSPEQVVVITFTEKAALELRSRIMEEAGREAWDNPGWRAKLQRLEWAPISTIHSFCARLLREYASRLGLDPGFAIMDASQFKRFSQRVLGRFLRQALKQRLSCLEAVLPTYKLPELGDMLLELLQASYVNALTPRQMLLATKRAHETAASEAAAWPARLQTAVLQLAGQLPAKGKYLPNMLALIELYHNSPTPPLEQLAALAGGNWGKLNPLRQQLLACLSAGAQSELLASSWRLSRNLLELFALAWQAIEDELKSASALSFDHLIINANRLLDQEKGISEKYPVVMVDEYQDVNPLQAALINNLAGRRAGRARLLVVGDRKQSIYGFRGADVSVFSQIKDEFSATDSGDNITICSNFRSNPRLVDFYNNFFARKVFAQNSGQDFEVAFDWESDQQVPGRVSDERTEPVVEIWDCRREDHKLLHQALQSEAQAVAGQIAQWLAAGRQPRDIVILLRRLTNVALFEQALLAQGVPFHVEKGGNFYEQAEVVALALGLASLEKPLNLPALLGSLLSPVFGLNLEALLPGLNPKDSGAGILALLADTSALPAWLSAEQRQAWQRASMFYRQIAPQAHRMQPAELIKAFLENTGWNRLLASSFNGAQQLANLRKLLEVSRQPPLVHSPPDTLLKEIDKPEQETQAPLLGANANVVRLMSVHQAKGLEFPIVILPELEAAKPLGGGRLKFLLSRQGVLALKLGLAWKSGRNLYTTPYQSQWNSHLAKEEAESARIFYVACTRAREKLVFCHSSHKPVSKWAIWVDELLQEGCNYRTLEQMLARPAAHGAPAAAAPKDMEAEAIRIISNCRPIQLQPTWLGTSASNLEEWLACPRRGWLRQQWGIDWANLPLAHAAGLGPAESLAADFSALELGNIVHGILELVDFTKAEDEIYGAMDKLRLPEDKRKYFFELLSPLWQTPWPALIASHSHNQREAAFAMRLQKEQFTMEINGGLDLLAFSSNKAPLIVDYKAGRFAPEKYMAQMACYALACHLTDPSVALPQIALCFFNQHGCQVAEKTFTKAELLNWQDIFLSAGQLMATTKNFSELAVRSPCLDRCPLRACCAKDAQ